MCVQLVAWKNIGKGDRRKKKKKETFEEILAKNSNFLIYKINPHDEVVQ